MGVAGDGSLRLERLSVARQTARAFEDNPWLSLTQQTLLVESLSQLGDVKGRANLIGRAIEVESHADGRNLLASVARLVQLHRELSPLVELLGGTRLPVARSAQWLLANPVEKKADKVPKGFLG